MSQDIANCLEFKRNTNVCTKCANNFYTNNGQCNPTSPEFRENCRESEAHRNGCRFCTNGFFKSGGQCSLPYSRSVIPNCLFTSSEEDNGCLECLPDHHPVYILSQCQRLPAGCIEFHSHQAKCNKCKEFHEGDNRGGCLPYPTQANCIQLKKGTFSTFDQANLTGSCEKCSDYSKLFLENGKCQPRTNFIINCLENKETEDRCKVCARDSVLTPIRDTLFCHSTNIRSRVLHCFAHDIFDPSVCRRCNIGRLTRLQFVQRHLHSNQF